MSESYLSRNWTDAEFTALSGWLNIFEHPTTDRAATVLYAKPCPGVLLQKRLDEFGELETRTIAATFDTLGPTGVITPVNERNYCLSVTEDRWAASSNEVEAEARADRDDIERSMLEQLAEAGNEGITAEDLIDGFEPVYRAISARQLLQADGKVYTTARPDASALLGRVHVFHLSEGVESA
ncbi:hypothetical protein ACT17_32785 [Mycolicibacterium conceptionense]|uniref:Uncharacterized protein n=1 Tax=Mycolicibacterium conceptionense TaxID=451644 RepID=A0A0J8WLS0_9MYCO|nr:hypothetical protein [Mycolicibacterium conceptionense]KMV13959.1 hypothetical protein ACT17_32785 [Mycolicibacterium conceptionense]